MGLCASSNADDESQALPRSINDRPAPAPNNPQASVALVAPVAAPGGGGALHRSESIKDVYRTLSDVEAALRKAGLESSDLILAIDLTKSNKWQGEKTFMGRNLHHLDDVGGEMNFYQQVISTLFDVLVKRLDDDGRIPLFGFGEKRTGNTKVFSMNHDQPCNSKQTMLDCYKHTIENSILSGPTSYAPMIYEAIDVVRETGSFHILCMIVDGGMDDTQATIDATSHAALLHAVSAQ